MHGTRSTYHEGTGIFMGAAEPVPRGWFNVLEHKRSPDSGRKKRSLDGIVVYPRWYRLLL